MSVCGNGRRYLKKTYCSDLLSLNHITYGHSWRQIYVHEIFKLRGGDWVLFSSSFGRLFIVLVEFLSQRAKGPLKICLFYGYCMQTRDKVQLKEPHFHFRMCLSSSTTARCILFSDSRPSASVISLYLLWICGHFERQIKETRSLSCRQTNPDFKKLKT